MLPAQKQQQIIARYLPIEDPQERMALVVDRARRLPPLADAEKTEEHRVLGCSSRVWIVAAIADGACRFRLDADSTLVKGLAGLLCELYDGATPEEVAAFEPTVLEQLHLVDHLSPTRRHGLQQVRRAIRDWAARALPGAAR
jgi:cysteine desulfuration protein SufE